MEWKNNLMSILTLTKENFDQVIDGNQIVFIDFWAKWCKPCLAFADTYQSVSEENPDIVFDKVDIEKETDLAHDFNVRSIPLLMVLKDCLAVFSETGTMPIEALRELVGQAKALDVSELKKKVAEKEDG